MASATRSPRRALTKDFDKRLWLVIDPPILPADLPPNLDVFAEFGQSSASTERKSSFPSQPICIDPRSQSTFEFALFLSGDSETKNDESSSKQCLGSVCVPFGRFQGIPSRTFKVWLGLHPHGEVDGWQSLPCHTEDVKPLSFDRALTLARSINSCKVCVRIIYTSESWSEVVDREIWNDQHVKFEEYLGIFEQHDMIVRGLHSEHVRVTKDLKHVSTKLRSVLNAALQRRSITCLARTTSAEHDGNQSLVMLLFRIWLHMVSHSRRVKALAVLAFSEQVGSDALLALLWKSWHAIVSHEQRLQLQRLHVASNGSNEDADRLPEESGNLDNNKEMVLPVQTVRAEMLHSYSLNQSSRKQTVVLVCSLMATSAAKEAFLVWQLKSFDLKNGRALEKLQAEGLQQRSAHDSVVQRLMSTHREKEKELCQLKALQGKWDQSVVTKYVVSTWRFLTQELEVSRQFATLQQEVRRSRERECSSVRWASVRVMRAGSTWLKRFALLVWRQTLILHIYQEQIGRLREVIFPFRAGQEVMALVRETFISWHFWALSDQVKRQAVEDQRARAILADRAGLVATSLRLKAMLKMVVSDWRFISIRAHTYDRVVKYITYPAKAKAGAVMLQILLTWKRCFDLGLQQKLGSLQVSLALQNLKSLQKSVVDKAGSLVVAVQSSSTIIFILQAWRHAAILARRGIHSEDSEARISLIRDIFRTWGLLQKDTQSARLRTVLERAEMEIETLDAFLQKQQMRCASCLIKAINRRLMRDTVRYWWEMLLEKALEQSCADFRHRTMKASEKLRSNILVRVVWVAWSQHKTEQKNKILRNHWKARLEEMRRTSMLQQVMSAWMLASSRGDARRHLSKEPVVEHFFRAMMRSQCDSVILEVFMAWCKLCWVQKLKSRGQNHNKWQVELDESEDTFQEVVNLPVPLDDIQEPLQYQVVRFGTEVARHCVASNSVMPLMRRAAAMLVEKSGHAILRKVLSAWRRLRILQDLRRSRETQIKLDEENSVQSKCAGLGRATSSSEPVEFEPKGMPRENREQWSQSPLASPRWDQTTTTPKPTEFESKAVSRENREHRQMYEADQHPASQLLSLQAGEFERQVQHRDNGEQGQPFQINDEYSTSQLLRRVDPASPQASETKSQRAPNLQCQDRFGDVSQTQDLYDSHELFNCGTPEGFAQEQKSSLEERWRLCQELAKVRETEQLRVQMLRDRAVTDGAVRRALSSLGYVSSPPASFPQDH